jgi:hypothetical protein
MPPAGADRQHNVNNIDEQFDDFSRSNRHFDERRRERHNTRRAARRQIDSKIYENKHQVCAIRC